MSMLRKAIEQAEKAATDAAAQAKAVSDKVGERVSDPATQAQARVQMAQAGIEARRVAGKARRGLTTIVEKIDPALLADVIIKATALQEKANIALRSKQSPYRINEVVISAAIPPQVSFSIVRVDDVTEEISGEVTESAELVEVGTGEEGAVLALDGSGPPIDETVDEIVDQG